MVWYGRAGSVASDYHGGSLGRVGQRLLLRVVLLAPNQLIVRLNLGPRIALGEVRYRSRSRSRLILLPKVDFVKVKSLLGDPDWKPPSPPVYRPGDY